MGLNDNFLLNLENHGAAPDLYPAMTDAQRLTASTADPNLHWLGANVLAEAATIPLTAGFPGGHVRMHGPNPARPGSSVSHFSTDLTPDDLMEPRDTGPKRDLCLTLALLQDVGWQVSKPATDLFMQDTPMDAGQEPNPDTGDMYVSQDIYVRNMADGLLAANQGVHQNPSFSLVAPNYVYVRVHNRGCEPASGELKVYWAKASTGLVWPTHWVNYIASLSGCAATMFGDQIPTASPLLINDLAPGADTIVEVPWTVPNPADFACFGDPRHFCLLARIETSPTFPYGMAIPEEVTDVGVNTRNNNNIIWKNLTVIGGLPESQAEVRDESVIVRNVKTNAQATTKFRFRLTNKRNQESFFQYASIDVNLGPQLFAKWVQGGQQGQGFQVTGISNTLRLLAPNATIDNIELDPDEWRVFILDFGLITRPDPQTVALFDLDVTQFDTGGPNEITIGGQMFAIDLNKIPLIAFGSNWKYLDTGVDLGNVWRSVNFNDINWLSGPAHFGFGDGDEATIINGGPATNRFITTYFRQTFTVDTVSNIDHLTFYLKRDDGGVVYLNGAEVFRNNMPTGAVAFQTTAPASAPDDGNAIITATVPRSATQLQEGQNTLAVEIHQNSSTSSDLSFDLALEANRPPEPPQVAITDPLPIPGTNSLRITAEAFDTDGTIALVEFFANLTKLGEIMTPPFSMVSSNLPPGTYCLSAKATDNLGMTTVSAPVLIIVPPTLSISLSNGLATISWAGPGILQEVGSLGPQPIPWVDVPNTPSSPVTIPVAGIQQFFRVRQ